MIVTPPHAGPPTFAAFTLPDGRRAGLCTEDKPRCVHGHHVKTSSVITDDGIFSCQYVARRGAAPCNATLWVALLHFGGSPVIRGEGTRFWIVIEVTSDIVRHIRNNPMTVMEKLIFLNATLPGVDVDILQRAQRERTSG